MWDVQCGIKILFYYIRNPKFAIRNPRSHPIRFQLRPARFSHGSPRFKNRAHYNKIASEQQPSTPDQTFPTDG